MGEDAAKASTLEYGSSKTTGACLACKKAHHACDQERPQCARCIRLGCDCEYVLHRKPGRKRLQACPVSEQEELATKKRRFFSEGQILERPFNFALESPESSPARSDRGEGHKRKSSPHAERYKRIIPDPRSQDVSRLTSASHFSFMKRQESSAHTSSQSLFGSFPQSERGSDRVASSSFDSKVLSMRLRSESENEDRLMPSTFDFKSNPARHRSDPDPPHEVFENVHTIRRPQSGGQKYRDEGQMFRNMEDMSSKRTPAHYHPHASVGHSKHPHELSDSHHFRDLVQEGEREFFNLRRNSIEDDNSLWARTTNMRKELFGGGQSRPNPSEAGSHVPEKGNSWEDKSRRPSWEDKSVHLGENGPLRFSEKGTEGHSPKQEAVMRYLAEKDLRSRSEGPFHYEVSQGPPYIPRFNPAAASGEPKKSPQSIQPIRPFLLPPIRSSPPPSPRNDLAHYTLPRLLDMPPAETPSEAKKDVLPSISYLLNGLTGPHS